MKHISILDAILHSTLRIKDYGKSKKIDDLCFEAENKGRLIKSLSKIQMEIEEIIKNKSDSLDLELISIWRREFNEQIEQIDLISKEILNHLNELREETTSEISSLYKNKQSFRGYNLNDVRK